MNKKQLLFKLFGLTVGIALLFASLPITKYWIWVMIPGVYLLNFSLFPWGKINAFLKSKNKKGNRYLGFILIVLILACVAWGGYTQLNYGHHVPFLHKIIFLLLLFFVCFLDGISESWKRH